MLMQLGFWRVVLDEAHMGIAEQALGAVLPEGWSEELDTEGRMYYWRTDEKLTPVLI